LKAVDFSSCRFEISASTIIMVKKHSDCRIWVHDFVPCTRLDWGTSELDDRRLLDGASFPTALELLTTIVELIVTNKWRI
jgi:hypothetical protein